MCRALLLIFSLQCSLAWCATDPIKKRLDDAKTLIAEYDKAKVNRQTFAAHFAIFQKKLNALSDEVLAIDRSRTSASATQVVVYSVSFDPLEELASSPMAKDDCDLAWHMSRYHLGSDYKNDPAYGIMTRKLKVVCPR